MNFTPETDSTSTSLHKVTILSERIVGNTRQRLIEVNGKRLLEIVQLPIDTAKDNDTAVSRE